jgi:L-fuconolactonase
MMRIDSHQHFWSVARGDYGWLTPDKGILYQDYLPSRLKPELEKVNIDRTILVQAAPTLEETEFLLGLNDKHDFIAGVVGWIDLDSEMFKDHYYRLRECAGFVGIRPMLQDLADDWILRPLVMKNLKFLMDENFPVDLQVRSRHLPYILRLLTELPDLRAVIDHAAKPPIAQGVMEPWKEHMAQIGKHKNIMCKLSGLVNEAGITAGRKSDILKPYVQHVVEAFGTQSIMYGSDWPVCLLADQYEDVYRTLLYTLPEIISESELSDVFGGNAARFYKI